MKFLYKIPNFIVVIFSVYICTVTGEYEDDVAVLTVASNLTEGYQRYLRSATIYDIPVTTLGLGAKWKGGDMNYAGGGQKINLLKDQLANLIKEGSNDDKIIIFTDSYDVMFLGKLSEIVSRFKSISNTRVLFSAEQFCWPDESLIPKYPVLEGKGNPFLNSGGFMGYLKEMYEIVSHKVVDNTDDDQLYYTNIYLNETLREKLKISLDHYSFIFQNLNGAYGEVELHVNDSVQYPFIQNSFYEVKPLVLHGNGPSKAVFNSLTSYLANAWSPTLGCLFCKENRIVLDNDNLPVILMTVFIENPTPFLEEFFSKLIALNYPKKKIHLYLRNRVPEHEAAAEAFVSDSRNDFASTKRIKPDDEIIEADARTISLELCAKKQCDFLFVVDSLVHLDDTEVLRDLLETNLPVVAPMVARPGKAWTNFWGALTPEGFYARSVDYMDIVHLNRRGVWNVPFISSCYLVNASTVLQNYDKKQLSYKDENADADMAFCASLRQLGVFMYVSNVRDFGHLIDAETFNITLKNPEIFQIFENKWDWEQRYIHPEYINNFDVDKKHDQPCPDVYWFPMTSLRFCKEYIEVVENFGQWSDGSNNDVRLEGGYEAVPTRDIHANQIGFERHWLYILKEYVRPLQELVFVGYFHEPHSLMNFVVRYKPDEQPSLRPHHDSSTYTINLALNTPELDYKGGGCHFIRYNCSVISTRPGWLLMHPGRLTHFHEGLLVTEGVRYIMISFINP